MAQDSPVLLVVDDETVNLEIITEYLDGTDYLLELTDSGDKAWQLLEQHPSRFSLVLLDRMMPGMDGMEVLSKIKSHNELKMLPVIIQSAAASEEDVNEGLKAGAHYYLTKPFKREHLMSVISTAYDDFKRVEELKAELKSSADMSRLLCTGMFRFQNIKEARNLATFLANAFPEPEKVVSGLSELFINSVEHGNLAITYDEKTELNKSGTWMDEIERRMGLAENHDKHVDVEYYINDSVICVKIVDCGDGFDWQRYMEFDPKRVFDNHGRGIAIANQLSFDSLVYHNNGSQVEVKVKL